MALQTASTTSTGMDTGPALQLQGVSRTYGDGRTAVTALRDVDLGVEPGEFVAVMGPSGSGKSTLLHVMGGMDRPTAGSVTVAGVCLDGLSVTVIAEHRRRAVGYVFQADPGLVRGGALWCRRPPGMHRRFVPAAVIQATRDNYVPGGYVIAVPWPTIAAVTLALPVLLGLTFRIAGRRGTPALTPRH